MLNRKLFVLVLSVVVLVGLSFPAAAATNLIAGDAGTFDTSYAAWTVYYDAATYSIDSVAPHTGAGCLKQEKRGKGLC